MGRTKNEPASASSAASGEKKPYEAPSLIEWGNLRDLTLTIGSSGASDRNTAKKGGKNTH